MSLAADLPGFGDLRLRALWTRTHRLFATTLLASAAIHVALVVLAPGFRRYDQTPPRPLEVAFVRPAVPEPLKPPPRALPKPPPKPAIRPVQDEVRRKPAPVPEPRQMLALPDPGPSAPSTFTVPQASVEPAPAAPEPKPAVAAAPAREAAPSTPANFNAAYLRNAPPRYPLIARRNGIEGTVRLKVFVTKEGKPSQVQLDQSSGSSALDNAALEAVRNWQFVPARRGQEAIESWVLVPVVFKLEGTS